MCVWGGGGGIGGGFSPRVVCGPNGQRHSSGTARPVPGTVYETRV